MSLATEIERALIESYGSLVSPHFGFAAQRYPYVARGQLVKSLTDRGFRLDDITDLNEDVCVALDGTSPTGTPIGINVSLVGPFVAVLLTDGTLAEPGEVEPELVKACIEAGYRIIDRKSASKEVQFEGEPRATYQLLFTYDLFR